MLRHASLYLLVGLFLLHAAVNAATEEAVNPANSEPLFAVHSTLDRAGRIMVPVLINGRGPFRLLVDTGANSTTLSTRLADRLGIEYGTAATVVLNGVTGSAQVPVVEIERLQAGALVLKRQQVMIVTPDVLADADGILGVGGLKDKQLIVDFKRDRVSIGLSQATPGKFIRIRAQRVVGGLLIAKARVGGVRTLAVIDTGAEATLGNRALQQALQDSGRARSSVPVLGATPQIAVGDLAGIEDISLGNATVNNARLTFGDFHVFDIWNLADEPALILGMDVIGTVDMMVIDFSLPEIAIIQSL